MNRRMLATSCAGLMLLLAGCKTQLEVRPDGQGAYIESGKTEKARIGVEYGLPMLQFKLQVDHTLIQCVDEIDGVPVVAIRFRTKVNAEPHYVLGESFVLDYRALAGWSKTSSMTLETYDNGVIKSFNASAEDQTGAIIGDIVKSSISLLSLIQGVPSAGDAALAGHGEARYQCSQTTIAILRMLEELEADLKAKTEALVETNAKVAHLERLAGIGALTEEGKAELRKAQEMTQAYSKKVAASDRRIGEILEALTVSEQIVWPKHAQDDSAVLVASDRTLNRIMTGMLAINRGIHNGNGMGEGGPTASGSITRGELELALEFSITLSASTGVAVQSICETKTSGCDMEKVNSSELSGLYYRNPVPAQLIVCHHRDPAFCNASTASQSLLNTSVLAPQLGPLRVLPMTNGAFQNNALSVAFRENGSLSKFTYDEKAARGKALSGALASGLDEIVAYRDAREAHKKNEKEAKRQAELNELDVEIARLERQKTIEDLRLQLSQDGSAQETNLETARLNARLALLEAQLRVRQAEEALNQPGQ